MSESLWNLRGRVREVKPSAPPSQADGFLNRRIRNVVEKRSWADLLKQTTIAIPDAYITGTVGLAQGSTQVSGLGTGWPTNDKVNTALVSPILDLRYVEDITPATMTGISVGTFLLIESENPGNMEIVSVTAVGGNQFTAYVRNQHPAGATVIASSLSGLQLRTNNYVSTVQAVISPTQLQIDQPWGGEAVFGQAYQIVLQYATITPFTKRLLLVWDPVQGSVLGTDKTWDTLNLADPQRTSTGDPEEMVSMPHQASGIMQWEIWPTQFSARGLNVVTNERWPTLKYDTDISPPFVNPEVFIAGAIADALRTRVIPSSGKADPYFDPEGAQYWETEFVRLLEEAEQADEARYMRALQNYEQQAQGLMPSYNFYRSHPASIPSWGGGY